MEIYAPILIFPWVSALILTPLVMRWAIRHGWLDHPRAHKQHQEPVPMLGGLAIFGAVAVGLLLAAPFSAPVRIGFYGSGSLLAIGLGAGAMVVLGIYDDRKDLRAALKLAAQVCIAIGTWFLGFRCGEIELPFGWLIEANPGVSLLITVGWIVVVTNAFNLIDGLDGLAAGLGILATLTIFVLAADAGASVPVVTALALAGALSGFLRYNIPPARIYLGDAGSMAIGYTTAVLSLASYQKAPTAVVLVVPFLALGLPLLDTVAAILRRVGAHVREQGSGGLHPVHAARAVMRADRAHIHHLLIRIGWSVRRALLFLYALSAGLGLLALWTRSLSSNLRWGLLLSVLLAGILAVRWLQRRAEIKEQFLPGDVAQAAPGTTAAPTRRVGTG